MQHLRVVDTAGRRSATATPLRHMWCKRSACNSGGRHAGNWRAWRLRAHVRTWCCTSAPLLLHSRLDPATRLSECCLPGAREGGTLWWGPQFFPQLAQGDVGDRAARVHDDRKLSRGGAQVQGGVEVPAPASPQGRCTGLTNGAHTACGTLPCDWCACQLAKPAATLVMGWRRLGEHWCMVVQVCLQQQAMLPFARRLGNGGMEQETLSATVGMCVGALTHQMHAEARI